MFFTLCVSGKSLCLFKRPSDILKEEGLNYKAMDLKTSILSHLIDYNKLVQGENVVRCVFHDCCSFWQSGRLV